MNQLQPCVMVTTESLQGAGEGAGPRVIFSTQKPNAPVFLFCSFLLQGDP